LLTLGRKSSLCLTWLIMVDHDHGELP